MDVLAVGLDAFCTEFVQKQLPEAKFLTVTTVPDFEKLLEGTEVSYGLCLCGSEIKELNPIELAQALRTQYANAQIHYITVAREGFDKKKLAKNGFNDAFLLPLENSVLARSLEDFIAQFKKIKTFRAVKIIDIQPDSELSFDVRVYLPVNKKYVMFSTAGDKIEKEKVDRLQKHKMGSVYVAKDDMSKFYDYSANRLIALGNADNNSMSETERRDRLQTSVRDLVSTVVNTAADEATIDSGRQIISDVKNIVDKYILNSKPNEWYAKMLQTLGEANDSYSHASNVSTYAGLFSIGLGLGKPEDLATAGLLHDLGMADIPPAILGKDPSQWTEEEKKIYQSHPEMSVSIIKARKLIVPQQVTNAILQHHERWDGRGYPKGMHEIKICKEAMVLSLADQFDYLTTAQEGKKRFQPREAIHHLQETGAFNPDFLQKVLKIIPAET